MQSKRIYKCFFKPLNTNFSKFFAQIWHFQKKKKKKKKRRSPCFFTFYGRSDEGNITIFFFWPYTTQTSKLKKNFFNGASTMLNNVFNHKSPLIPIPHWQMKVEGLKSISKVRLEHDNSGGGDQIIHIDTVSQRFRDGQVLLIHISTRPHQNVVWYNNSWLGCLKILNSCIKMY